MRAVDKRLLSARARLHASGELARRNERVLSSGKRKVIALPARPSSPPSELESVAPLLDFTEHQARRDRARASQAQAERVLDEIVWNIGESDARPLVESVLALLASVEHPAVTPEIEALRGWLARHPL
jgi:hypothetical protein